MDSFPYGLLLFHNCHPQNGSKILRSKIARSREWGDSDFRQETVGLSASLAPPTMRLTESLTLPPTAAFMQARVALENGRKRLAAALTAGRSTDLRKGEAT